MQDDAKHIDRLTSPSSLFDGTLAGARTMRPTALQLPIESGGGRGVRLKKKHPTQYPIMFTARGKKRHENHSGGLTPSKRILLSAKAAHAPFDSSPHAISIKKEERAYGF